MGSANGGGPGQRARGGEESGEGSREPRSQGHWRSGRQGRGRGEEVRGAEYRRSEPGGAGGPKTVDLDPGGRGAGIPTPRPRDARLPGPPARRLGNRPFKANATQTPAEITRPSGPAAAAAAKSLQSCPTLCDPIDGSPVGSSVPGILQARILEWVAISLSSA